MTYKRWSLVIEGSGRRMSNSQLTESQQWPQTNCETGSDWHKVTDCSTNAANCVLSIGSIDQHLSSILSPF